LAVWVLAVQQFQEIEEERLIMLLCELLPKKETNRFKSVTLELESLNILAKVMLDYI
jgi:hypothetical protein